MRFQYFSFSGKSQNCYGLAVTCQHLWQHGHEIFEYDENEKDALLISCYWPEQILDILRFRYTNPNKGRLVIIGGNTPTVNPAIWLKHVDGVFVGDGERWDGSVDHESIASVGSSEIVISQAETLNPIPYFDVQDNKRTFVEIARGCKNKCFFCQYGWLKKYREASLPDIRDAVLSSKTKSIRLFSADRFQHSQYQQIRALLDKRGKCDTGSDASLKYMMKNKLYYQYTNKIRTGIEGMSERLRWLINKPLTDDQIVQSVLDARKAGIGTIDWYMIYGLPGETTEDINCFKKLLNKINDAIDERVVIAVHWNAFTPSAQTPFQWAKPAYRYKNIKLLKCMASNDNRLSKLVVYHKPLLTSDHTIAFRTICIRSGVNSDRLMYTLSKNKSLIKNKTTAMINAANEIAGVNIMGEWPVDKEFPWDGMVKYKRDRMIRIWNRYDKRVAHDKVA